MSPDEAFRATLSDCLAQMTANAATVRTGRSVEGLHQLRVAFRRLEVALGAFAREFGQDWLEELRGRAKVLSGRLAPARDLDVFVGELLDRAVEVGRARMLAPLRARAESARDAAWKQAPGLCRRRAISRCFLDDVAGLAASRLPLARRQAPAASVAARILDAAAEARVKSAAAAAQSPRRRRSAPAAHRAQEAALYGGILRAALSQEKGQALSGASCAGCRIIWASSTTSPMCAPPCRT